MTLSDFKRAFKIASSDQDLSNVSIEHLFGYGLKTFQPTATTIEAIAVIMRWQALQFNGTWIEEELEGIRFYGKKKFLVIN